LVYITHPWLVPKNQHVLKIWLSVCSALSHITEGWLATHNGTTEH
jgi:hypothetical protein